ncbi:MAG: hypothetical protein NC223_06720 [Butyrivibrio sp.]|nr:hypothetical protein [Butyrivibrio sp.]
MDRVELGIKLDQINKLRERGEYADAAKVCDTIDWRRIKKWSELSVAQEIYEKAGRTKDSRNVCVYAYNRNLGGKRLLFKLTEMSIAINDLEEADDLYREFVEAAPRDMERYILLYKLNKARGVGSNKLIDILEEYKQNELDEQYEYELAELYAESGRIDDCVRECDDLILWFNEGEYVEKALRLKAKHAELTKAQRAKLKTMEEFRAAGLEYESVPPAYESEADIPEPSFSGTKNPVIGYGAPHDKIYDEEYRVPEKDYSIYDTQNVQAELAKNMAEILEGIKRADYDAENVREREAQRPSVPEQRREITLPDDTDDYYGRTAEIYTKGQEPYIAAGAEDYADDETAIETPPEAELSEAEQPEAPLDDLPEAEPSEAPSVGSPEAEYGGSDSIRVDEPTKEIRINTHHWKRYRSYMVEDEEAETETEADAVKSEAEEAEKREAALPKYLVEKSEVEAESVTGPEFIIEDLETIVEISVDETEAQSDGLTAAYEDEAPAEPVSEEAPAPEETEPSPASEEIKETKEKTSEEMSEETPEQEPAAAEEEAEAPAEPVKDTVPTVSEEPTESAPAEPAEDGEVIDGQIDLLSWLSEDSRSLEAEAEHTEENAQEAQTVGGSEFSEEAQPDGEEDMLPEIEEPQSETEEDKSVEEAMDEMTRMLMEEVAQDIEEREKQKKPTGISEEEYIATAESQDSDASDSGMDGEETPQAAEAESAAAKEADDDEAYAEENGLSDNLDDEDNDFVLKDAERKCLHRYLFIDGLEAQAAQIINRKKKETHDGTSSKGNIVILGKSETNKKNFAIDLFKAMHAQDGGGSLKIARTTAAIINRNGITSSADKIKGMTLIIEHAHQLTRKSVGELCDFMRGDTQGMLVMLTGEDYAVKRVFAENPDFAEMFDYTVHIRQYTVNEFVAMAKEYSGTKGYLITDRALLKLYLMIDGLAAKDEGAQADGVRRIVDNAIERSRKRPKKSGALIRLKEKDFAE